MVTIQQCPRCKEETCEVCCLHMSRQITQQIGCCWIVTFSFERSSKKSMFHFQHYQTGKSILETSHGIKAAFKALDSHKINRYREKIAGSQAGWTTCECLQASSF